MSILSTEEYPSMIIVADEGRLAIHNMSGSKFFDLKWDAISGWTQDTDATSGEPVWMLMLATKKKPPGVYQLLVRDPSDPDLWDRYLEDFTPNQVTDPPPNP